MATDDRSHFTEYREQTRVKHGIVEKYIFAYFNILKAGHPNLVYIDGFAGRGTYDDGPGSVVEGSPLRALRKISSLDDLKKKVTTIFIEQHPELAAHLQTAVNEFISRTPGLRPPIVRHGDFASRMNETLEALAAKGLGLAPSFLFVDPCGVAGTSFATIQRFLQHASCEVLVFFNLDGVRRILGLGSAMGGTLAELLGSKDQAAKLLAEVNALPTPGERERCIVAFYETLLRTTTPAKYISTFRVEYEDRRVTSHYLIHATRHQLGFGVMKGVMWSFGKSDEGGGGLALEQASIKGSHVLFSPRDDSIRAEILRHLDTGNKQVRYFSKDLVEQPDNKLCEKAYKQTLLAMEADGSVIVLDKSGTAPAPSSSRRKIKGAATLGDDYWLRSKRSG